MAVTKVSDVVIPEIFAQYMQEALTTNSIIFTSGLVVISPELMRLVGGGGKNFDFPFWKALSGDPESIQTDTDLTVNSKTAAQMTAVRLMWGKAWGHQELAAALAGDNPTDRVQEQVGEYWDNWNQKIVVAMILGVLANNVAADTHDLVNDISTEDGDNATSANYISASEFIDTFFLLGDKSDFSIVFMHSEKYADLRKQQLIDFKEDKDGNIMFPTYMGLAIIVSDDMPKVAGTTSGYRYLTVLAKAGAFAYGDSDNNITPVEIERLGTKSTDILITRVQNTLHPQGFKWIAGSVADQTPTYLEIKMAANWDRVYEKKNCGFVGMWTN